MEKKSVFLNFYSYFIYLLLYVSGETHNLIAFSCSFQEWKSKGRNQYSPLVRKYGEFLMGQLLL